MRILNGRLIKGLVIFAFLLVISGCAEILRLEIDPIVNRQFPPVSIDSERAAAVLSASTALGNIKNPGLLVNLNNDQLTQALAATMANLTPVQGITVTNPSISTDQQAFHFTASVTGSIPQYGATFTAQLDAEAVLGMTTVQLRSFPTPAATVTPALNSAKLTALKLDKFDWVAQPLADAINDLIGRYIANINGQFARNPLNLPIDVSQIGLSQNPVTINISGGRTIVIPGMQFAGVTVLADNSGLHILADIEVNAGATIQTTPTSDFTTYQTEFWNVAKTVYSTPTITSPGIFLSDYYLKQVLVNGFIPVNYQSVEQTALNNLQTSLGTIGPVAVGAYVAPNVITSQIQSAIATALAKPQTNSPGSEILYSVTFGSPNVLLDEQAVIATVPISGTVGSAPGTPVAATFQFAFSATVSAVGILSQNGNGLYYRLVATDLALNSVQHTSGYINPAPFIISINTLLDQLVPYLNGATTNTSINIPVPTMSPIQLPQSASLISSPTTLTPAPIHPLIVYPRLNVLGLRVLVSEYNQNNPQVDQKMASASAGVSSIATLLAKAFDSTTRTLNFSTTPTPPADPTNAEAAFDAAWANAGLPQPDTTKTFFAAVGMPWLTGKFAETLNSNHFSITGNYAFSQTPTQVNIGLGSYAQNRCVVNACNSSTNNCSQPGCSRQPGACGWSCSQICVNIGLGNWCTNDPVCEAGLAACNAAQEAQVGLCLAQQATQQGLCEAGNQAIYDACQAKNVIQQGICDVENGIIAGLQALGQGGLGQVSFDSHEALSITLNNPSLTPTVSGTGFQIAVGAALNANAAGSVGFSPANQLGSLLICPIPISGSASFNISTSGAIGITPISGHFQAASTGQGVDIALDPFNVNYTIQPAPLTTLLVQNPAIQIVCSPASAVADVVSLLGEYSVYSPTDLINALTSAGGLDDNTKLEIALIAEGKFNETLNLPPVHIDIPASTFSVGQMNYTTAMVWSGNTLVMTVQ